MATYEVGIRGYRILQAAAECARSIRGKVETEKYKLDGYEKDIYESVAKYLEWE